MKWLASVRKLIGKLTDLLIQGRQAGLWQEGQGPTSKPSDLDRPKR